jgi:predicted nucleotidyltransferase
MRLNKPINKILNSETKIKVLRLFCSVGGESTGRQIAKLLKVGPSPVQIALADLYNEGILERKSFGKAYAYSLNSKNWLVESSLKPMFRAEAEYQAQLWAKMRQHLEGSDLGGQILSVSLFGSVLSGQDRPTSDIDLLVIFKEGVEKQAIEDLFIDMNRGIIEETGLSLDAHVYSVSELREKVADGVTFIKDAIRSSKLILGKSLGECL